jgi:hypothetical protein
MRGFLIFTTRVVVSLGLLYLVLRGINFAAIQSRLSQINVLWIVLAVAATIFPIFLGALRWREISDLCRAPLSDLRAFRYNMIGSFFNQTLPSSIGGDAVRLWLVNRTGAGWRACPNCDRRESAAAMRIYACDERSFPPSGARSDMALNRRYTACGFRVKVP